MLPSILFMFTGTPSPPVVATGRNATAASAGSSTARDTPATAGSGGTRSTPATAGAGSVRT